MKKQFISNHNSNLFAAVPGDEDSLINLIPIVGWKVEPKEDVALDELPWDFGTHCVEPLVLFLDESVVSWLDIGTIVYDVSTENWYASNGLERGCGMRSLERYISQNSGGGYCCQDLPFLRD